MSARYAYPLPFGAQPRPDGHSLFRIWAPTVDAVSLELRGGDTLPMNRNDGGWYELRAEAPPGTRYRFRLPDGLAVPDPASRLQDGDVHGWSVVFDATAHEWQHDDWRGRPWHETVIYELHAGLMRGFLGVADELERLRDLGFTAIELMPVNDFPGQRNWGYDGVLPYAPDESFGTPGQLKTLIDRAHGLGLMVFLDVVYNHFGPDGAYQHVYGGKYFFDEGKHSPWGAAIDFNRPEVRDYFIQNAIYWIEEYRFDGLRFDAVHAYANPDFADAMARAIRSAVRDRHVHLVMEHEGNVARHLRPGLFDAQWADDTHHALHVLLTQETEGYYLDFKDAAAKFARSLSEGFSWQGEVTAKGEQRGEPTDGLPTTAFVAFLQNHDQTGNRAMGERLTVLADPDALRAAQAVLLLAPQIPLIFMGEEVGARAPFLFFTDHHDELADLVREGRRREFAHFSAFADPHRREQIPDPNAEATFELSRLDPADSDPEATAHMRVLLGLRHRHIVPRLPGTVSLGAVPVGDAGVVARWQMGDGAELILAANFGAVPLGIEALDGSVMFETSKGDSRHVQDGTLPPRSAVALMLERT